MKRLLALTMGEPAGIGGEIAAKAWVRRGEGVPPFFLIGEPCLLSAPTRLIDGPDEAADVFPRAVPVWRVPLARPVSIGHADPANAPAVLEAIRRGVTAVTSGKAAGLVTLPIRKETLYQAGFRHPGHTEYLAELAGGVTPVMMLLCPGLRVVPVTIHVALKDALARLSAEAIVTAGRITAAALVADFGIAKPRLAVAGLNPHAGEGGALGREEIEIIAPAVEALRAEGIAVFGPAPPDTLFHERARSRYDAALCMYHDQALIPLKTIDFERGVNVTLGLPFVRTSPDHGTALDIAGSGIASPESLIAALMTAAEMATRRSG
jgi:4-hydroxythreonine-4-phosphate dehydrogenase